MATVRPGVSAKWPRHRLLLALLLVSVVLNVFFVAGALWTRLQPAAMEASPAHRFQQMAAELDLDAKQRTAFDQYVAVMRARNEKLHQQIEPLIRNAWEEMAKPQPDTAQVLQVFDTALAERRELLRAATVQTLDFLATLSPAQREKFVAITRQRRARLWQHHSAEGR